MEEDRERKRALYYMGWLGGNLVEKGGKTEPKKNVHIFGGPRRPPKAAEYGRRRPRPRVGASECTPDVIGISKAKVYSPAFGSEAQARRGDEVGQGRPAEAGERSEQQA